MPVEYDLAVVGGGIAGLYCCLNAPAGSRVALFEATSRFGGKLETVNMNGFLAEYGSMRFDPSRQPLMGQLVTDLGLETEPFPEYSSPAVGADWAQAGLEEDERGLNALALFARGVARVLGMTEQEMLFTSAEELDRLRREGRHRGKYLWELGIWEAFSGVLSHDAIKYIMMDGSFFHGLHENPGVAGTMIVWVKMLQMSLHLKGIKGGVQLITDRMLEKVKRRGVNVFPGRPLQAVAPSPPDRVTLTFEDGEVRAKHVILALPSAPLRALRGLPADIRTILASVIEYPLLKCFFVVRDPWWEVEIPNMGAGSLPTRELHHYRQGGFGNVMVYADRPSINYWKKYANPASHEQAEIGHNEQMCHQFARYMKIDRGRILSTGIRDWSRPPYGAGVHLWRSGVKFWKLMPRLEAFSLNGGTPNVHICGEAFSDYQGFMEGALRTARAALAGALA